MTLFYLIGLFVSLLAFGFVCLVMTIIGVIVLAKVVKNRQEGESIQSALRAVFK